MLSYSKTGNTLLDLGLGYVWTAYTEPALFKAFYMDNVMNTKLTNVFPESINCLFKPVSNSVNVEVSHFPELKIFIETS